VGLPVGTNRRVPGLRRSEVATLAGVSVEYYTRLERGAIKGASPEVLGSLARALCLDDAERAYLFDLAHAASPVARPPRRRMSKTWTPHTSLQWALDAVTAGPAFVRNGRLDLLAVNLLTRAFYMDLYDMPGQPPNIARFTFLNDRAHEFYPDWDVFADVTVAILRTEAGRDPHNKELHDLIGELSTRSDEFRRRWGAHNVRHHGTGVKHSTTASSASSPLPTKGLRWPPSPASPSPCTRPSPVLHRRNE
jgi:transcriptional regulator with XRE-family HTH domain